MVRAKDFMTEKELILLGLEGEASPEQLNEGGRPVQIDKRTKARTDHPTHSGEGQIHTHLISKGTPERIVNLDGTASHNIGPFRVSKREAEYLRSIGHKIPDSRLVEDLELKAREDLKSWRLLKEGI